MKIKTSQGEEEWLKTDLFCVDCGRQYVWMCPERDDYYQGEQFICEDCGSSWNFKGSSYICKGDRVLYPILQQLGGT